jgi:hypothetical protein
MDPESDKAKQAEAPKRQPYEPPAIEETSEFETLALACTQLTVYACGPGYTNS